MNQIALRRIGLLVIAFCAFAIVPACNTVEGVGKDVKATGSAIERAGDRNK